MSVAYLLKIFWLKGYNPNALLGCSIKCAANNYVFFKNKAKKNLKIVDIIGKKNIANKQYALVLHIKVG
jgi:hypothetical protein